MCCKPASRSAPSVMENCWKTCRSCRRSSHEKDYFYHFPAAGERGCFSCPKFTGKQRHRGIESRQDEAQSLCRLHQRIQKALQGQLYVFSRQKCEDCHVRRCRRS